MSEYSQSRSFNVGIAQDTSIEAALIYDDLVYAEKLFGKGNWFYRSDEFMLSRLPFIKSKTTLRKHINLLVDAGVIEKKVKKVEKKPTCHYRICQHLVLSKTGKTMEIPETGKTIYIKETNKETKRAFSSFGGLEKPSAFPPSLNGSLNSDPRICPFHKKTGEPGYNCRDCGTNQRAVNSSTSLLQKLINIVNPREKVTDDRLRNLNARLKDYSEDEIVSAAHAFSKSDWHRENGQMSIDNLIRASKFGRWYAEGMKERPPTDKSIEKFRQEEEQELKDFREGKGKWASPSN